MGILMANINDEDEDLDESSRLTHMAWDLEIGDSPSRQELIRGLSRTPFFFVGINRGHYPCFEHAAESDSAS